MKAAIHEAIHQGVVRGRYISERPQLDLSEEEVQRRAVSHIPVRPESFSGVYFLLRSEVIVYVGQSKNVYRRIAQHGHQDGKDFDSFAVLPVPPAFLYETETYFIQKFSPPLNDYRRVEAQSVTVADDAGVPNDNPGDDAAERLLLTEVEAARALGFTPRFLQNRRLTGDGPPFVRISSRAIRYRPEDLRVWIQDRVRSSTSDNGGGDR